MSPTTSTTGTTLRTPARERLLAAADELFYAEGVHTVGIDRVIERAGVAKASLYNAFGSKDELIREYLAMRHERRVARITQAISGLGSPRERLLGVYDVLGEVFAEPGFRGCAFTRARAEDTSDSKVAEVCDASRAWTRRLFTDLAREAGAAEPEELGRQLQLLYDGANASAYMDGDVTVAATARSAAAALLDAALRS